MSLLSDFGYSVDVDTRENSPVHNGQTAVLSWWRSPSLLAAAILLLGTFLRFMQMGDIRYGYDHSYPAYQALQWLDGGRLLLIGQPSSVFLDNPVLMTYLQAIPLLLGRSPWLVYVFIIALNSLAIWFVYLLGRDLLGVRVGLIAAFLFAVNPWIIFFSRTSWVQSLLPLLMAVIAWGIWPRLVDPQASARRFLIGGAAVTVLSQTYIQAWGILPQLALLLFFFRRHIPKRAFAVAVTLFSLAALLYAGGLATRWEVNLGKLANFASAVGDSQFSTIGGRHALRFVNGVDFEQAYAAADGAGSLRANLSLTAVIVLTLMVLVGFGRALLALRQGGRTRRIAIVLLTWLCIPVLLTALIGSLQIHPHYLLLTVPAEHLLAAWGIGEVGWADLVGKPRWGKRLRALWQTGIVLILLLAGLLFSHDLLRANHNVARQPVWPEFDGWSLASGVDLGHAIQQLLDPQASYPKRIVANGNSALLSGLSGTYLDTVGGVEYPDFVLLPSGERLLYVLEGGLAVPEWLRPFMIVRPEHRLTFANGEPISFVQTETAAVAAVVKYPQQTVLWPSEAGITLVGYSLGGELSPGKALDIITYWRVDDLHPDRNDWYVSPSYHLVNDQGQIVANIGQHGQYAYRWQLGDVYIEHISVPIPENALPGLYSLHIGLFDPIRIYTYPFFSSQGAENYFSVALHVGRSG